MGSRELAPSQLTLAENMVRIERRFQQVDKNGDGEIDLGEFTKLLPKLGLSWDKESIKTCLSLIDKDGNGKLDIKEFKNACYMACMRQPNEEIDMILAMVLKRMMKKGPMTKELRSLGAGEDGRSNVASGFKNVQAPERAIVEEEIASKIEGEFTKLDADMDGLINFDEFSNGIKQLGLGWSPQKINTVLSAIGDKTINFQQFKSVLQAACEANPKADVTTIFRTTLINLAAKATMNEGFRENKVKRMMKAVDSTFDNIDSNKDGKLDLAEFTSAVKDTFGLDWDDEKIASTLKKIDSDGNGTIERMEFRQALYVACMRNPEQDLNELIGNTLKSMANKGAMAADMKNAMKEGLNLNKVDAPERKLAYEEDVQSRIQQKFAEIDMNKDGSINVEEFGKALKELGLKWQEATVKNVLGDLGENGEISFNQFRGVLDAACEANPTESIDFILKTTLVNLANKSKLNKQFNNAALKKKTASLDKEFSSRDKNKDGTLDMKEFADAIQGWGLSWSSDEIKDVLGKIDTDQSGDISLAEFKRAFSLAASKNPALELNEAIAVTLKDLARRNAMNAAFKAGMKSGGFNLAKRKTKVKNGREEEIVSKIATKFQEMDLDGDGALNIEEFSKGIQALGLKWGQYKIRGVLRKIDTDGSGDISFSELGQVLYAAVDAFPTQKIDDLLVSCLENYAAKSTMNTQFNDVKSKRIMETVQKKFAELDKNGDGQLDLQEFTTAVKAFGLDWEEARIQKALNNIDTDNNGTISAQEFKSALYMACMRNADTGVDEILQAVLERMEQKGAMNAQLGNEFPRLKKVEVNKREFTEEAMSKIEEAFAKVDVNKDGVLTPDELASTTKRLGLNWDEKECKEIINRIDLDGTGQLQIFDFAHVVSAAASKNPNASVDDILKMSLNTLAAKRSLKAQMREQGLKKKMRDMDNVFKEIDKNGDGKLDLGEFTTAMSKFNLQWSDQEVKDCLAKIDTNGNGCIERNEYQAAFYNAAIKNPDLPIDEIITCALQNMMSKGSMNARFSADFSKVAGGLKKTQTKAVEGVAKVDVVSEIEAKFMGLDQDLDGMLSYEEFASVLANVGLKWDEAKTKQTMSKIDTSGKGKIQFQDFKNVMFRCANRHPDFTIDQVLRTALANLSSQKAVNAELRKKSNA